MWRYLTLLLLIAAPAMAQRETVDLALVLAVDVSESIDAERYALQMKGIAAAFEAPEVQSSMLGGPHQAMLVAVVQWSDKPTVTLGWTLLTSPGDIDVVAQRIRHMRRAHKGFTCMSVALRSVADKLVTQLPVPADRIVIDVSGDGRDNCNPLETVDVVRNELVASGVSLNGLPILEGDEAWTLEAWYRDHVMGGLNSFVIPAMGFADIERAMRRKFVTEISGIACTACVRSAGRSR